LKIHPKQGRLEDLLCSLGVEHEALLRHLVHCESCRDRLLHLNRPGSGVAWDFSALDYGEAFDAAARSLRSQAQELARERAGAPALLAEVTAAPAAARTDLLRDERFHTWGLFELLVDRALETSIQHPAGAQDLAALALAVADTLSPFRYRPELVEDLRGRAWVYLGNARRLTSDFRGAEQAFARAAGHLDQGTGDPVERAVLLDREASLFRAQRRFEDALDCLGRAVGLFLRNGERHRAGRSLINLSLVHSYAGETAESIAALYRALELIDPEEEPRTLLCARHNLAGFLAEAGRSGEALDVYRASRALYRALPDPWTRNRRKWLKGKIDHGLGRARSAEVLFKSARDGFVAEGIPYDTALVSLDLALLYAEQGRAADLKQLAAGMIPLFASCHIHREALAALRFFQSAVAAETATCGLLARLAGYLRRAEHDPDLCWEPAG
jgi:tetratricopeptide (TPR) repeat protein